MALNLKGDLMALTAPQTAVLRADLVHRITPGDPLFNQALADAANAGQDQVVADFYNTINNPDFWVWKSKLTRKEILETTTPAPDNTTWSWTIYIGRSQGERDAFVQIMTDGVINPSLPNIRAAFADIFSGAGGLTQRTHLLAVGRRKATTAEKLLADTSGGNGQPATPAVAAFEGQLTASDTGGLR